MHSEFLGIFMDSILSLLILFTFPSFCVRVLIFYYKEIFSKASRSSWIVLEAFIVGICQDLFVTIQLFMLFSILDKIIPLPSYIFLTVQMIVFLLIQLNIIFDAYLYLKTSIRLDVAFFAFINDLKCFWDSAKAKGVGLFLPGAVLFLIYPLALYPIVKFNLINLSFTQIDIKLCVSIAMIAVLGRLMLSKKLLYSIENAVFHEEIWVIKRVFSLITSKKNRLKTRDDFPGDLFLSQGEVYVAVAPKFPLLKYTQGFTGEKQYQIDVASGEQPNIIFLFMESFRAKDIGCFGGSSGVSSNFDRVAKEGILYSNFYANSIKTSRALTASLFGVPSDIASHDASRDANFPFIGIADILSDEGYHTAYLHNGDIGFENQFEFLSNHGFSTLYGKDDILKRFPNAPSSSWGLPDEYLMQYTTKWLQEQNKPTFLTMFTMTNHHPWVIPNDYKPPKFSSALQPVHRQYLETFHYSDEALGQFVSSLDDNTILFILGDHGQAMGEHNQNFTQQKGLYEENIHIPLLIYAKNRIKTPAVITDVSSQLDLLPTVMDLLGIRGLNHSIGSSLLRKTEARKVFFYNPYVYGYFGVRQGDYKLIYSKLPQEVELYDLKNDPNETNNCAKQYPKMVEAFLADVIMYKEFFKELYDNKRFVPEKLELEELLTSNDKCIELLQRF